jgi:uncharacterized protein YukE
MRRNLPLALLISTISALGIYLLSTVQAANSQIKATQATPNTPAAAAPTTAEKIEFRKKTIRTMKDELEQTTAAVQSSNYGAARDTFKSALKKWYTFGGTVKRLAPETYEKVADGFKTVNTSLNQSQPQQKTLISDLQGLTRNVKAAVTVSDAND